MRLYEWQGKKILHEAGLTIPKGILLQKRESVPLTYPVMCKAQVLSGKRKKAGLVQRADTPEEAKDILKRLFEKCDTVLVEECLAIEKEYYLAFRYDTVSRSPQLMVSKQGGIDIEEGEKVITQELSLIEEQDFSQIAASTKIPESIFTKSWDCFTKNDCKLLEINPLIRTADGFFAADAKITIDDNALGRQHISGPKEDLSDREIAARKIDEDDYRGVAGKTFADLDGDIAVIASGGGASLTAMDALITAGGSPANYVEFSGNPSQEKVYALTKLTLSKPKLKGCLVIGGTANFTDVYETMSGFAKAVKELEIHIPIVVRRAGPRDKEAFAMLEVFAQKNNLDITLFGEKKPLSQAVQVMVQKAYGDELHATF